ncbi:GntR family transcriptional regulator [Brachybacterium saurashtrense]|uniref:GntR family transcriptional regulator n=1 Tax=Brachybacterium saurashtrense TaxID=556288 RepID=A0A345YRH4_9MICO|nr:GntR family transcriptional regulator [Brachybacterium saurashtrense]AXK46526.1 GntR family transcriptional regulator [Brachybacterium saurashtrense]RRR24267.1 GntR family transcriptional regulator [Brachybacterium saurashtrense]
MPAPTLPWLDSLENRPIATQIAAATAHRITTGTIEPGELLREVEVAARHGASRTPAREAMLQLETWGLVRLIPKKGALVTTPTAREREELLSVRAMLEGHAVARIVPDESRREGLLQALAPVLEAQRTTVERPEEFAVHDYAFHLTLASHEGNRVVEEVLRSLGPRLFRLTHLAVLSPAAHLPDLHREHVELTDTVRHGDVTGFRAMIEEHLRTGHDAYQVVAE